MGCFGKPGRARPNARLRWRAQVSSVAGLVQLAQASHLHVMQQEEGEEVVAGTVAVGQAESQRPMQISTVLPDSGFSFEAFCAVASTPRCHSQTSLQMAENHVQVNEPSLSGSAQDVPVKRTFTVRPKEVLKACVPRVLSKKAQVTHFGSCRFLISCIGKKLAR